MLGGVVEALLKAMRTIRPQNCAPVLRHGQPAHAVAAQ